MKAGIRLVEAAKRAEQVAEQALEGHDHRAGRDAQAHMVDRVLRVAEVSVVKMLQPDVDGFFDRCHKRPSHPLAHPPATASPQTGMTARLFIP